MLCSTVALSALMMAHYVAHVVSDLILETERFELLPANLPAGPQGQHYMYGQRMSLPGHLNVLVSTPRVLRIHAVCCHLKLSQFLSRHK